MSYKPNIFNIPANYNFFESFFDWLQKNFANQLAEVKIFLPNRYSCRQFHRLFLEKKINTILPKTKAIADISYEDFFEFLPHNETSQIIDELLQIKVISDLDYLFFLSREVQKLAIFGDGLEFNQAIKIAAHLQTLFDDIAHSEVEIAEKLSEIDDSDLSLHRQLTLDFLKKFYIQSKNSLVKKNVFFASAYQNLIVQKFSQLLENYGSKSPIIVAGSTGSISFNKKFIRTVSQQKNGYVLLYGLSGFDGNFASENHPQFFLNQLLEFLKIEKKSVSKIANEKFLISDENRQNLLSLMMLSSEETLKWQNADLYLDLENTTQDLSKNFQLIEAKNEVEEAKIIALALVKNSQLKENEKKSALITNNYRLADLVKAELRRFSCSFSDSRDQGVHNSKLVNFLLLILDLLDSDFNSHSLLAALKHPLCNYSLDRQILIDFEIKILRQERKQHGLVGIEGKLTMLCDENLNDFFTRFCKDLQPLTPGKISSNLGEQISALIKVTENLSKKTWQELLEQEPAQSELSEFFNNLKLQNEVKNDPQNLLSVFKDLVGRISFFEETNLTAKIQILSTREARLLNHDLVIVGSLNEGDFPEIEIENWLGKKIKKDLGIYSTLKKIGQNAYHFCNYLSNSKVILTRSRSNNGMVLIESPFLLRFKTLGQKIGIKLGSGAEYFSLLKRINGVGSSKVKASEHIFNPKPTVKLRPKKFSITEISRLISDPYSIYSKKILQLRELPKIDFENSYAEFGSFVHLALEQFIKNPQRKDFLQEMRKVFEKKFLSDEAQLLWWPKFKNIFFDFLKQNEEFLGLQNYVELPVKLRVGEVLITGKIDRVVFDQKQNLIKIFDYKTGQVPGLKNVTSGLEPQLTIAALALVEGSVEANFPKISVQEIDSLNYWKLSSSTFGEITKINKKQEEIEILVSAAKSGLSRLFEYFSNPENGYKSMPNSTDFRYNEYWHLARAIK